MRCRRSLLVSLTGAPSLRGAPAENSGGGGPSHHGLAPRAGSDGRPHPPGPAGPMQAPRPAERGLSGESASHSEPEPPTKHYSLWQGSGVLSKRFPVTSGRGPAGREAQGHSFHQRIRPHLAVHERAWKKKKKKFFFFFGGSLALSKCLCLKKLI